MAFPRDPRDTVVELFIGETWVDVTATEDVHGREPLMISSGRPDDSQGFPPATCGFTLDNRTGKYNPRNPLGGYYGQIGRSTPVRVRVRTAWDLFGRTVVNGWGTATTGQPYTLTGVGGTVQASDFQVSPGAATHSVPVTNAWRAAYFPTTVLNHRNVDAAVTVSVPFTNVTGADIEPANFMFHVSGTPTYYLIRVKITTTEAVQIVAFSPSGSQVGDVTTVPGLTHSSSQPLRVRAQCDGYYFRAKVWPASGSEPFDWPFVTPHGGLVAGGVGLRSGVASGNTNTLPIVFTYSDFQVSVPRFAGEVGTWNQRFSEGIVDAVAVVEVAGILRRLGQGNAAFDSAPRREARDHPADAAWPLEDSTLVAAGAPSVGNVVMQLTGDVDPSRQWGQGQLGPWLPNVVSRQGIGELHAHGLSQPGFVNRWSVSWVMAGGKANNDVVVAGRSPAPLIAAQAFVIDFSSTVDQVEVTNPTGGVFTTTSSTLFAGGPHHVEINASESGGLISWFLAVDGVAILSDSTGVAGTLQPVEAVRFRNLVDNASDLLAIGYVKLSTVSVDAQEVEAAFGWSGETSDETAGDRLARLCSEEGIPFTFIGSTIFPGGPIDSAVMGPQYPDPFLTVVAECAVADIGELYEPRGATGLEFRTGRSLYNQPASLTLDFAADHLAPPLEPTDDDQQTHNKIRLTRRNGGEVETALTTGPLSTADPSDGGIGTYETGLTLNVEDDEQLPDLASWLLHLGTFDGARYPQIRVSLGRPAIANNAALANAAMDVNIGDKIAITNASAVNAYDQIDLIVRGIVESIDAFEHIITFNCTPEVPYQVVQVDTAGKMKANTAGSVLHAGVSSSATSLDVATTAGPPWVTAAGQMPVPITISGEAISATAIADSLFTFIAAGTAAHASNASVSPGLPAGHTTGDLLLIYAAIRNSPTGIPNIPAGYTLMHDNVNARLFGKVDNGSESAPTVSFTGGVANADTSAQMACLRGNIHDINRLVVAHNGHLNVSAQDIPYTGLSVPYDNCVVLYLGWKQDDWTSVASPGTEIGEPDTTTGDDQGLVWAYTIQTTATPVSSGQFTVTGGASAISRAGLVVLRCDRQTFTGTRSVNGVAKPHSAGAAVALTRRATVGL